MTDFSAKYEEFKRFIGFSEADRDRLVSLAPVFAQVGPAVTDRFYTILGEFPETARMIEGRVDLLKTTHARWMSGLFGGEYGDEYANERMRIGKTHVRVGLDPSYVEGVMCMLRTEGVAAISAVYPDSRVAADYISSYLRILDLDLFIINHAYAEERLDRLSRFTGMKRVLIENVIRKAG